MRRVASWFRHDTKSDDVPGICSSGHRIFPQNLMMIGNESNARASVAELRYVPSTIVAAHPETLTQPDPATYDQLVTSHYVDKTDYIVQPACYLFNWSYPLF